jgi:hypothetical protein
MYQDSWQSIRRIWLIVVSQMALLFSTMTAAAPPSTQRMGYQDAERLIQLNMMLLVTHRRCSILKQPFDREFISFHNVLKDKLAIASSIVKPSFQDVHADLTFDSFLTATANAYGEGHPEFGCKQIKAEFAALLKLKSDSDFHKVADQLLSGAPKHKHPQSVEAIAKSDETKAAKETVVAHHSEPAEATPSSKLDATRQAEEKSANKAGTPVQSGSTKEYTGGSRIKDF